MLANLLPGFRDLRAPLTAGYVWLCTFYIAFEPLVPGRKGATGVWHSLYRLHAAVGTITTGVALSVLAYLIGSVSQGLFDRDGLRQHMRQRYLRVWLSHPRLRRLLIDLTLPRLRDRLRYPFSRVDSWAAVPHGTRGRIALNAAVNTRGDRILSLLGDQAISLQTLAFAAVAERDKLPLDGASRSLRPLVMIYAVNEGLIGDEGTDRETIDSWDEEEILDALLYTISQAAVHELDLARTGLLGKETEMFSVIDRLQAEAEFRTTLAPAIVGLATALLWRATWWSAALLALTTTVLLMQGRERSRRANDALLEALRIGRTGIPLLDQIDGAIEECRNLMRSAESFPTS